MTNYYQTLGVSETASADEIKLAYKKLAMKHHPDRGGDAEKFKEISVANDILSDPQKRAQYDAERNGASFGGNNPFGAHFGFDEVFQFHFGQGFANFNRQPPRKNRDITVQVKISLKQSYTGTQMEAKFNLPSGKQQTVLVDIPAGIVHKQAIRYHGLGDDSIPNIPRGNLNVTVLVEPDSQFERVDNDLHSPIYISLVEAMTGCTKDIKIFDEPSKTISIAPGTQDNTSIVINGKGFANLHTSRRGNFVATIKVNIPAITDPDQINKLKDFDAIFNKTP